MTKRKKPIDTPPAFIIPALWPPTPPPPDMMLKIIEAWIQMAKNSEATPIAIKPPLK